MIRSVLIILLFGLVLSSCTTAPALPPPLTLPTPAAATGPAIPFFAPNILGDALTHIRPIADASEMLDCLDEGQTVYAIALQNSNVRVAPEVDACRIGRIPRGSLVEVVGAIAQTAMTTTVAVSNDGPAPTDAPMTFTLGYVEDIQPIFQRTCNSCHSAVVQNKGLQVTAYAPLMKGGTDGPVVIPGDAEASLLWQMVGSGKMPLIGQLAATEKDLIRKWIDDGAPERRQMLARAVAQPLILQPTPDPAATRIILQPTPDPALRVIVQPTPAPVAEAPKNLWLQVAGENINPVADQCRAASNADQVVSSDLIYPLSCGVAPRAAELQSALQSLAITLPRAPLLGGAVQPGGAPPSGGNLVGGAPAPSNVSNPGPAGIQAAALNLPPVSDADGWLQARGGFCIEQRQPQNDRGITALAFAPDGRLFMALDQSLTDEPDPLILYDAHHPSRSIAVYDPVTDNRPALILDESTRMTGMTYYQGALYLNRAGEVGRIVDGGKYEPLAGGFAVNSQLFHANDGIAIVDGWLYVSAGGVIDGYSDGPIEGIGEAGAQNVVSGGNGFAARIVRAPLDQLLSQRSISVFQTAARGVRNPYGLTVDPSGRLWFTDNGATNVPENVSAGDEVNFFDQRTVAFGTPEDATPYFGFPLALTAPAPAWYTPPVVALPNTTAPTSITWAYGTIYFGAYGRDPGLYRLGRTSDGSVVAERIMLVWPLLATATAPDGALWIGTGGGGLFRIAPGCG